MVAAYVQCINIWIAGSDELSSVDIEALSATLNL